MLSGLNDWLNGSKSLKNKPTMTETDTIKRQSEDCTNSDEEKSPWYIIIFYGRSKYHEFLDLQAELERTRSTISTQYSTKETFCLFSPCIVSIEILYLVCNVYSHSNPFFLKIYLNFLNHSDKNWKKMKRETILYILHYHRVIWKNRSLCLA